MFTHLKKILSLLLLVSVSISALADDTKILSRAVAAAPPKILFLLDNSNSMNTLVSGDSLSRSRLQILQDTFVSVIDSMDQTIKVGLSYYSGAAVRERGIAFPVSALDANATTILTSNLLQNDPSISPPATDDGNHTGMFDLTKDNLPDPADPNHTVKDYLKQVVNGWTANYNTPIPSSILETVRYFKGQPPLYGDTLPHYSNAAHPSTYTGSNYSKVGGTPVAGALSYCARPELCPPSKACHTVNASNTSHSTPNVHTDPVSMTFSSGQVSPCITDGTCASTCTANTPTAADITAAEDAYALYLSSFTPVKKECKVNDGSCGTNCNSISGDDDDDDEGSESLYRCDSLPVGYTPPATTYTCSEYFHCEGVDTTSSTGSYEAVYNSPITDVCDNTFLVLLSDGQPVYGPGYQSGRKASIINDLSISDCAAIPGAASDNTLSHGECGPELTYHLANTDLNSTLDGDQFVNTYTIGFGVTADSPAERYLKFLAQKGNGNYYSANNSTKLNTVFNDLLKSVSEKSALSLAGAAFSVNASTQIAHNDDVFIPVIKKIEGQPHWAGNIKKYKIADGVIVDKNDSVAISARGSLKSGSQDLWATTNDTDPALSGGAASLLNPVNRKLYTDIGGTTTNSGNKGNRGTTLTELKTSNDLVTQTHLSVPTVNYRNELLDYIRGYAIPVSGDKACTDPNQTAVTDTGNCTPRLHMGDILHSKPVVISYDDSDAAKRYVFFGTNEGYLHAINADDGAEKFAFMPQSLLENIDTIYRNDTSDPHVYGVDGSISVWRYDANNDGKIKAVDNDHVYIYFGLRRGGRAYYALNITDPANPKLLWKKDNNSGGATSDSTGFAELGQTWSKPLLAKIRYKASGTMIEKQAMVVGGGYDPDVDEESRVLRNKDGSGKEFHQMGRAVYILDAETGNIIKAIAQHTQGVPGMKHSIPGDIRVLDMDKNGFMDRFYFADTGGNIWRSDLFTDTSNPYKLHTTTRKFASLGEDTAGGSLDVRKFFYEPEVALFNHLGAPTLAITLGSGYHSQPLNTDITDRFYVLIDSHVYDVPATAPTTITQGDLLDRSSLTTAITANSQNKAGWYYTFPNSGEKVLSTPLILLNKVLFTTFTPNGGSTSSSSCAVSNTHQSRLYTLNLLDGATTIDFNKDGTKDLATKLPEGHILSTPQVFFRTPDCTDKDNCEQVVDIKTSIAPPIMNTTTHPGKASRKNASSSIDIGSFTPTIFWLNTHQ